MKVKTWELGLAIAICGVSAGVATAASQPWKFSVDSLASFNTQADKVRKDMGENGRFGAISVSDRSAVESDLDKIAALLKRKGEGGTLADKEQVDLLNAQESINAILTRNEGNRLICSYERRSGSNFKQKVCQTAREREATQRASQEGFQRATNNQGSSGR